MRISRLCHESRWCSSRIFRIAALIGLVAGGTARATTYTWPISKSFSPDGMNTSFGPRVNNDKWDFHDGVDLPAACGTPVYAVAGGTVVAAAAAGGSWKSQHVVIKVDDPNGAVYVVYLHLQSFAVTKNASVAAMGLIGAVGKDGAAYCHLHLEFRQVDQQDPNKIPPERNSRHPLHYLPYTDNPNNFSAPAPADARFNRQIDISMRAARLVFGANDKNEGDLSRVEVDLKNGMTLLAKRWVDFDDKTTINEGNGDDLEFVHDIAVEGYQDSDMDGNGDLKYGVVVRNLPVDCNTLVARVYDLGNHVATSVPISVPNQIAVEQILDFEDGSATPAGWLARTSTNGTGTSIANDVTVAHTGTHSLLATDGSDTETSSQQAAIELNLDTASGIRRFEWMAEGWIRPNVLDLAGENAKQVYLLHFLDSGGTNLSVSARLRNTCSNPPDPCLIQAGIVAKKISSTPTNDSAEVIGTGSWCKWTLRLLRAGTRKTTAVLLLDDAERARLSWDSTAGYEPALFRVGVGQSFSKVKAILNVDDVRITEKTM